MKKKFRPGVGFSDFVIQDAAVRRSPLKEERPSDYRRGWLVWLGIFLGMVFLVVRLVSLQVMYGERYRLLADENRIKTIRLPAQRGKIVDRNGAILAQSKKFSTTKDGIEVEAWQREYPYGEADAAVTGYIGEIGAEEVGLLKTLGGKYEPGDMIGRSGVEQEYEEVLRGVDGGRLVEVDNQGKIIREMGRREPLAGKDIKLTLDQEIQQATWEAMENKKGAAIVSQPGTGEILALVSSPSFNPNWLVKPRDAETNHQVSAILTNPELPMFNRAIGAIYPPGSTFKMVTTLAAITEKKVDAGWTMSDPGVITVAGFKYANWLFTKGGGTEGSVGFTKAITRSTDTFFYKVGEMTGPELLGKWAKIMGLGQKLGIDLPGETEGLIPSPEWKKKVKSEAWFLGNTYHMAIGQGDVLVTPLQINLMTATLAAGGQKCQPRLWEERKQKCEQVAIEPEIGKLIKTGMVGACSQGGTAFPLFDWNTAAQTGGLNATYAVSETGIKFPLIACKTGTAEYLAENGKMRTHGWLTAYAPVDKPEVAITVVMEGGGEGSNIAAPVVRKILAKKYGVNDKYPYSAIPQEMGE